MAGVGEVEEEEAVAARGADAAGCVGVGEVGRDGELGDARGLVEVEGRAPAFCRPWPREGARARWRGSVGGAPRARRRGAGAGGTFWFRRSRRGTMSARGGMGSRGLCFCSARESKSKSKSDESVVVDDTGVSDHEYSSEESSMTMVDGPAPLLFAASLIFILAMPSSFLFLFAAATALLA